MSATVKPLFDLTLTEEQTMMRETVRRFVSAEMRPISRKSDEAAAPPDGFYDRCNALGFTMVPIAEAHGGMGAARSPVSNVLIAEDLAYGDMSLALGALSSLSVVNALTDFGSAAQQAKHLPSFASESFRPAAIALLEPTLRFDPLKPQLKAQKRGNEYVLRGEKTMVPFGDSAETLLVIANEEGAGPQAFIVEKGQAGVKAERESYMGLRPLTLARVTFDDAVVPASAKLGDGEKAFDLRRLVDLARIGVSALAVGVCQAVLDYTKDYCKERVAFGEPIAQRQAVAFMIADIAIELDAMRLLVYRAAARAEQGMDFKREAYLARTQCAEMGMKIGTDGVQLLGGHGFIREHMVELWYRNLRAISVLEGLFVV